MVETGTASGHADLLAKLHAFLTTNGSAYGLTYAGTGNGTLTAYRGGPSSIAETMTVTATSSTTFSVVGSASGSLGTATVGTAFVHAKLAFLISAGATAFVAGDKFALNTAPKWTANRAAGGEYLWTAPGNDGASAIYVGAKTFSDTGGAYYNWRLLGAIGYSAGSAWEAQPGACIRPVLPLYDGSIPYRFIADGRRVVIVAQVSGYWETAYLGLIDTYASPGQYPYPLAVGGSMAWATEPAAGSSGWRWSSTAGEHSAFACPRQDRSSDHNAASLRLRAPDGSWRGFLASGYGDPLGSVSPYCDGMSSLLPAPDGTYTLHPIMLSDAPAGVTNIWGELRGVAAVTGYGRVAGDTVTLGTQTWLVAQNTHRTDRSNYFAVRLD